MKNLLTIFLISLSLAGFGQTQISTSQIRDGAVTQQKLATDATRPVNSGVLTDPEILFASHFGLTYTIDVEEDIALTLSPETNVINGTITITATGDGTHVMTFPATWIMKGDAYNPDAINEVYLRYNGYTVIGEITAMTAVDVLTTALTSAIITASVPTQLNLTFNEPVNATSAGWIISASAAGVTIGGVSGSGTANIIFTLSRTILPSETVTVSYSTDPGETFDLAGFELAAITDFNVVEPEAPPVVNDCPGCTITVGPSGEDFTTITAANAVAVSGDIIGIRAGTYRETITAKAGVTYRAFQTAPNVFEAAIISGFEVVGTSGWTVHSGNIYKKTITLPVNGYNTSNDPNDIYPGNTTIFANQLIRNGVMMPEARWPNLPNTAGVVDFINFLKWENYRQLSYEQGFGSTSLTDATLPVSSGLTGAVLVSNGWFNTFAGTVTQTGATTLSYGAIPMNEWARKAYYLTNDLQLLDGAGEWHYESGTLYFWQPGGGTPTGTIEYKARNWGFDIRGKQNVKIIGLTFTGVDPAVGDATSTGALIEKTTATYNNHHVRLDKWLWNGGISVGMPRVFGTKLLGANSVFKDNDWSKIGSAGVWLGPNCRAENNKMEYIGYSSGSAAAFSFWDRDDGQVVTRNSMHYLGRSGIDFGYVWNGDHLNVEISYNDIGYHGMITGDAGATYAAGQVDLSGLQYHHNWLHDNMYRNVIGQGGLNCNGIYYDQASGGGTIHHNVVFGSGTVDMYHETFNGVRVVPETAIFNIYNNTFAGTYLGEGNESAYRTYSTNLLDVQRNNIYFRNIVVNWQANNIGNNQNYILQGTNPVFVGTGTEGLAYRIQTSSPAKNTGQVITGITDGSVGVPDIGAYEFGGEEWIPGYTVPVSDGTVNDTEFTYSLNWLHFTNFKTGFKDNDVHATTTLNSTASYDFHGTQVAVVMEKCNNMGTARFEVLDGAVVVDTQDVDLYVVDPGGSTNVCPTGNASRETVFTSDVLAEGDYTMVIKLQAQNTGATPSRNSLVLDNLIISP